MDRRFIEQQLVRFLQTTSEFQRDALLASIGFHVGLLPKTVLSGALTFEQRKLILNWIQYFKAGGTNPFLYLPYSSWDYSAQWIMVSVCEEKAFQFKSELMKPEHKKVLNKRTHQLVFEYWQEMEDYCLLARDWLERFPVERLGW